MITNITTGVDPARVQMGKPAFFVSWQIDGQQMYYFSAIRSSVESVKRTLQANQAARTGQPESPGRDRGVLRPGQCLKVAKFARPASTIKSPNPDRRPKPRIGKHEKRIIMFAKITRRSTVGFGYTSACENDDRGNLRVCQTTAPVHTGTILTVQKAISDDVTLRSWSNGTYYTTAWFVKVDGTWHRIKHTFENDYKLDCLTDKQPGQCGGMEYQENAVTVEIE